MKLMCMNRLSARRAGAVALVALGAAACSLDKQEMPSLSGPSGLGLAITMVASPDQLPRDGVTQSVVTLTMRDVAGQALANRHVALSVTPGATLTQSEVVTGAGGTATFGVVAPTAAVVISGNRIVLSATPVGSGDAANASVRVMTIGLTGAPNGTEPKPDFTTNPALPEINQVVTFDATATVDENKPCLDECTYAWDFDDNGATASGRVATHKFPVGRPYNVALTVTDTSGVVITLRRVVTVTAPDAPKVDLEVVPAAPIVNRLTTFTATATPAKGHSVVRFEWSFGDGSSANTAAGSVDHTYTTAGTFAATVRAIDDLGQAGSKSLTVIVGSGIKASFTISPSDPVLGQAINVDASASTSSSGTTIAMYAWNWGDGNSESSSSPTASHTYASKNNFTVTLTITDSQGGVGSFTSTVTIK